jgi:acyl-CoA synthetase (AMP-forming)/AMP-acid ligase II
MTPERSPGAGDHRLYDRIAAHARRAPDADAAIEPGRSLTYAGLLAEIDACATALMAAGVRVGDRIATLAPPGLDFLVTFLASASVGAVWTGLNPRYADPELDRIIARIDPAVVFATDAIEDRQYGPWMSALPGSILVVTLDGEPSPYADTFDVFIATGRDLGPEALQTRREAVDGHAPCLMVFTSGSTGGAKGALISQAALIGASLVQLREWDVQPLRVLNNLPINHIGCVGDLACYALTGGGALIFQPRFAPQSIPDVIAARQVTVWGQVPTMFQLTLDNPAFDPTKLRSLQLIFWGGAHAPAGLVARLRPLAPRLATSWGQTETVGSITFATEGDGRSDALDTVGRPVAPYEVRITDARGEPSQTEGEIEVRSPFAMSGYWRDPEATAAAVSPDGWRRTGDIGVFTDRGELRLVGRVHDVFKSGGYNVYPKEIEDVFTALAPVSEAAVIGVPDALYGAVAFAFVRLSAPADEETLRAQVRERLANYKVPRRIVILDDLPRLPIGKIDKQALQALAAAS